MTQPTLLRLKATLKQLKLPTRLAECAKVAQEAASPNQADEQYLLRRSEPEVAARRGHARAAWIRAAAFPVAKDFDTDDFSVLPRLPKQKGLDLARGDWIEPRYHGGLIGKAGTGKTPRATALGLTVCRQGQRVRFLTAAPWVTPLE